MPYSWRADPDRHAEDADEQALIARTRQDRQKGIRLRAFARTINLASIDCRGHLWHDSVVLDDQPKSVGDYCLKASSSNGG